MGWGLKLITVVNNGKDYKELLQKNQQKWLGGRYMRLSTETALASYSSYIYLETTNDIPNLSDSSAGALELPQNTNLIQPCPCHALHANCHNLVIGESLPLYHSTIPVFLDSESCTQLPCHSHLQRQLPISVSSFITVVEMVGRKENMAGAKVAC